MKKRSERKENGLRRREIEKDEERKGFAEGEFKDGIGEKWRYWKRQNRRMWKKKRSWWSNKEKRKNKLKVKRKKRQKTEGER